MRRTAAARRHAVAGGARPDLRVAYAINEGAAERLQLADGRTAVTINVGEKGALAATITAVGEAGPRRCRGRGETRWGSSRR